MKKIILSLIALCSIYAAQAASCVTVQQVSTNYATNQVTFDLKWGTCNNTNHLYRVWVFVDYRPVTITTKGAWDRAIISATDKGTLVSANKGVWVTGSANATQRVTLTLEVEGNMFDWCAFAIDYPPNATMSNGVYTLEGSPPFTVNGVKLDDTQNTCTGSCISSITDATNNPDGFVSNPAFSAGSIPSTGQVLCSGSAYTAINSVANATGGDSRFTYRWLHNGTEIAGTNSANYTPTQVGTYTRQAHDGTCNTDWITSAGSWVATIITPATNGQAVNACGCATGTTNCSGTCKTTTTYATNDGACASCGRAYVQLRNQCGAVTNSRYSTYSNSGCTAGCAPPGSVSWTKCGFSYVSNNRNEGWMNRADAATHCASKGMRLPTQAELRCMCSNKGSLPGGYENNDYWSTPDGNGYDNVNFTNCAYDRNNPSHGWLVKCVK